MISIYGKFCNFAVIFYALTLTVVYMYIHCTIIFLQSVGYLNVSQLKYIIPILMHMDLVATLLLRASMWLFVLMACCYTAILYTWMHGICINTVFKVCFLYFSENIQLFLSGNGTSNIPNIIFTTQQCSWWINLGCKGETSKWCPCESVSASWTEHAGKNTIKNIYIKLIFASLNVINWQIKYCNQPS